MQETPETFSAAMTAWQQWQDSPWGRLRFSLAEANLARHLDDGPLRVLDLAGGDGGDAIRLAVQGHHITIADYAPTMLAAAAERAADAGVASHITCVEADVTNLPAVIADSGYDVVLCHNLLQYVTDVAATLTAALTPLRPGGLISAIALNRHAEPLRVAIQDNDPAAARSALDTAEARTQTFDTTITLRTAEETSHVLAGLGCPVIGHYGIRSVCDYLTDNDSKHDPAYFADLERLELAVSDRPPYLHTARFFHLIGRKPRA